MSSLDNFTNAREKVRSVADKLEMLSDAFDYTGNARMAQKLAYACETIYANLDIMDKAFAYQITGRLEDSKTSTGIVLALAMDSIMKEGEIAREIQNNNKR